MNSAPQLTSLVACALLLGPAPARAADAPGEGRKVRFRQAWHEGEPLRVELSGQVRHDAGERHASATLTARYAVTVEHEGPDVVWNTSDLELQLLAATDQQARAALFAQLAAVWPCDAQLSRRGQLLALYTESCTTGLQALATALQVDQLHSTRSLLAALVADESGEMLWLLTGHGHAVDSHAVTQ